MENKFISFTFYKHKDKDYVIPHRHNCYELIFYSKGSGRTTIADETYSYKNNTLVMVEENVLHDDFAEEDTDVYCIVFSMSEKILKNAIIYEDNNNKKIIEELFRSLSAIKNVQNAIESNAVYIQDEMNLILLLTMQLMNLNQMNQKIYIKQMIEWTMTYLRSNYKYNLNLEIIAERLGYSYDRFRHIFKEYTGNTLYQYLSGIRLSNSKKMLADSALTIKAVGKACGFKSAIRFSNWFKEKTGISPQKYRVILKEDLKNGIYNKYTK